MTTAISKPFSPEEFSAEHVAVAFLAHRFTTLPPQSVADIASLAPEFANCGDRTTFLEIMETMKEILFPELLGDYHDGKAGSVGETDNLKKRMEWIGKKIKEKRKALEMTQEELAERSGLPQSHISRLEAGLHSPSARTLERLAEALKVQVGDLDPAV